MSSFMLRALGAFVLGAMWCWSPAATSTPVKRPMIIHKVQELGLEVWTEAEPQWEVKKTRKSDQTVIFTAETPALTAPPAGLTWISNPGIRFAAAEIREGARGAIRQAALNYGVPAGQALDLRIAQYGDLAGYEADFPANAYGTPVDVRVFCGHQPGKPAVVMHAFTLRGKLPHIAEHIRRSWTHVRYLQ
jgi:hypothetical protein